MKKNSLHSKLTLKKKTIVSLSHTDAIKGGATVTDNGCMGSGHCDIKFTDDCVKTRDNRCVRSNHCDIVFTDVCLK